MLQASDSAILDARSAQGGTFACSDGRIGQIETDSCPELPFWTGISSFPPANRGPGALFEGSGDPIGVPQAVQKPGISQEKWSAAPEF